MIANKNIDCFVLKIRSEGTQTYITQIYNVQKYKS